MMPQHHLPADIERTSMNIIAGELAQRGLDIPPENAPVVKRVIHTTADFDYAQTLHFTPGAVAAGVAAMHAGRNDHHRYQHGPGRHHQAGPGQAGRAGALLYGGPRCGCSGQTGGHHPRRGRHAQGCGRIPRRRAGRGQRPHRPADDCRENRKRLCARRWLSVCRWAL